MGYVHENHKLIAADPRKSVRLANPASHSLGDLLQHAIPRLVAQRVVDCLETVDIEQEQSDLASAPCRGGEHLRQTLTEVRPVGELGQLILPREPRDLLDFLRQQTVRTRDSPEQNRGIDRICDETEDDRGTEERVLLPIRACGEVPDHAENRDGRREKQVVATEPQPPPYRSDDAVGKTAEASHHHETADPYDGADQARLRLTHLDAARRLRAQPMPERQKPIQKSFA